MTGHDGIGGSPAPDTLYVYVDETGNRPGEKEFIVAMIVVLGVEREAIEETLQRMEGETGKGARKWQGIPPKVRAAWMRRLITLSGVLPFYYALHGGEVDYLECTAESIIRMLRHLQPPAGSRIHVTVDGLVPEAQRQLQRLLARHRLPYRRTVRGARDESSPLIRVADAVAGFVRHARRGDPYTPELMALVEIHLQQV